MRVIYFKEILKEAKKEYENSLKNVKNWEDWDYYRFYLWHLVYRKLRNEINSHCIIKYGKKVVGVYPMRWDYLEHYITRHFWSIVYRVEYNIRDKYYLMIKERLKER